MSNHLSFIKKVLEQAAIIARDNFGKVTSSTKEYDNNQVLTQTDIAIGQHIIDQIEKDFPNYNIIDEEAGAIDKKSNYTWVVDPIDGTSNFANGLPTYGCMVGLLENDIPIAGGIILPAFDQLFLAEKGHGATCNDSALSVSKEKKLESVLVAYGIDGHQEDPKKTVAEVATLAQIILHCRNLRTTNSAYDMAHVADGKYGAYLNRTTKIWDNVALQPIIEEAGGVVTDFWGKPTDYTNALQRAQENFTICAAAPILHQQLQDLIHQQ